MVAIWIETSFLFHWRHSIEYWMHQLIVDLRENVFSGRHGSTISVKGPNPIRTLYYTHQIIDTTKKFFCYTGRARLIRTRLIRSST